MDDAAGENSGTAAGAAARAVGGGTGEQPPARAVRVDLRRGSGSGRGHCCGIRRNKWRESVRSGERRGPSSPDGCRRRHRQIEPVPRPAGRCMSACRLSRWGASSGSSREARLQRLCDSLGDKLSESQAEVEALERMCAEHQLGETLRRRSCGRQERARRRGQGALAAQAVRRACQERDTLLARAAAERAAAAAETRPGAKAAESGLTSSSQEARTPATSGRSSWGPGCVGCFCAGGTFNVAAADLAAHPGALAEERKAAAAREGSGTRALARRGTLSARACEATRLFTAVDAQAASDAESRRPSSRLRTQLSLSRAGRPGDSRARLRSSAERRHRQRPAAAARRCQARLEAAQRRSMPCRMLLRWSDGKKKRCPRPRRRLPRSKRGGGEGILRRLPTTGCCTPNRRP